MDYVDEVSIRSKKIKRDRAYADIKGEGIFVQDRLVRFSPRVVLERLEMYLPDGFIEMPAELAAMKYPSVDRPQMILTSLDGSTNFAFNLFTDGNVPLERVGELTGQMKELLRRSDPSYVFEREEMGRLSSGSPVYMFDHRSFGVDEKLYEKAVHKDLDPAGAIANTGQEYSLTWTSARKQYEYFSDPKNGYMEGGVVKVRSLEEYYRVASLGVIEAGDLLYWDENGDGDINHATIINGFDESGSLFTGNTRARFDHPVDVIYKEYLEANSNSSVLYFVRMKDSVFTSCPSSD